MRISLMQGLAWGVALFRVQEQHHTSSAGLGARRSKRRPPPSTRLPSLAN